MTDQLDRLKAALADRYTIERVLGSGGMATVYAQRVEVQLACMILNTVTRLGMPTSYRMA